MTTQFEDVLSALCTDVSLGHANESQKMFLLRDSKEAKLARDVLVACGFDAKAYDEDNSSKLYINLPSLDATQLEQKLSAALAYAASLKQIKQSLDNTPVSESPDYTIMFANHPTGKQVVINFASPRTEASAVRPPAPPPPPPKPVMAAKPQHRPSVKAGDIFSGPAVGKKSYQNAFRDVPKSNGQLQQMFNYVTGHMIVSMYGAFLAVVFLLVLYTLFVFSKSFLCPDFATEAQKQNHAWYCQHNP